MGFQESRLNDCLNFTNYDFNNTKLWNNNIKTANNNLNIISNSIWDNVYTFNDDDGSACDLIKQVIDKYKNDNVKIFFGNGGDRTVKSTPEVEYCQKNGIEMLWEVGGNKIQSSSDLVKNADK